MERLGLSLVEVAAGPGETIAHRRQLDSYALHRAQFAKMRVLVLEELDASEAHIAAPSADEDAERGGGFALTIAGIDDHEAFLLVGSAGPLAAWLCGIARFGVV